MLEIYGSTQASIFGDFSEIKPKPVTISKLVDLFSYKKLLPVTFTEISPIGLAPQSRIRLESENHEWGINFAFGRVYIEKVLLDNKGDQEENYYSNFVDEVLRIFQIILDEFNKKGFRLSFVTQGLLPDLSEEKLENIYTSIFSPIDFYSTNLPTEWNSRKVARLQVDLERKEIINVITNISRTPGQLIKNNEQVDFDRIEVGFDINTFQGHRDTRFTSNNIEQFFRKSLVIREEILDQLRIKLNV